ncbi:MAG TPA: Asp-tRNA(Asn)/Glu-tRNA(Gln) amidotransferase subunit GatC [Candidatus Nanoarchaeia archaeon]|nr:Asp-tRNA(Asn)/Glu-tRNA(Gln) amidotransferase subunit GatC [Candidatus Nanoarchaeia archaeon]
MEVNREVLEHAAKVARLKLTEEEVRKFLPQMKELLEFFSKLKEVNTDNVNPSFQPVLLRNVMRDDTAKACLSQEDALMLTLHKKDGYFKGPKVV